jgi:RNA polymerase sigma-70 factor (ECF subfamily)
MAVRPERRELRRRGDRDRDVSKGQQDPAIRGVTSSNFATLLDVSSDSDSDSDDARLWQEALGGKSRSFGVLFDRYYLRVFRYAQSLGVDPSDVDDITAATFLTLWRHRARVQLVENSILPWLLVTTRHNARNRFRQLSRYRTLIEKLPHQVTVRDASQDAEDRITTHEYRAELLAAINRLHPIDARLIELTSTGEATIAQASTLLGLSPGAARVRLHRARKKIRSDLARTANGRLNLKEKEQ